MTVPAPVGGPIRPACCAHGAPSVQPTLRRPGQGQAGAAGAEAARPAPAGKVEFDAAGAAVILFLFSETLPEYQAVVQRSWFRF